MIRSSLPQQSLLESRWLSLKESAWMEEMWQKPGEINGTPLQYSCLEKSPGLRSMVGYSPRGRRESDMADWLTLFTYGLKKKVQEILNLHILISLLGKLWSRRTVIFPRWYSHLMVELRLQFLSLVSELCFSCYPYDDWHPCCLLYHFPNWTPSTRVRICLVPSALKKMEEVATVNQIKSRVYLR